MAVRVMSVFIVHFYKNTTVIVAITNGILVRYLTPSQSYFGDFRKHYVLYFTI